MMHQRQTDSSANRMRARFSGAGYLLALVPVVLGALALIGWLGGIEPLRRVLLPGVQMSPLTAAGLCLLGLECLRVHARRPQAWARFAGVAASMIVVAASVILLLDQRSDSPPAFGLMPYYAELLAENHLPAYIAPNSAISFVLLGAAAVLLHSERRWALAVSQCLALATTLIGLLAFVGHVYRVDSLYMLDSDLPMAAGTALGFLTLSLAMLFARADAGFMRVFAAPGPARTIATFLVPVTILGQFFLGWLMLRGRRAGYFDASFGYALSIVLEIGFFVLMSYLCLRRLNAADEQRRAAEEEIRNLAYFDTLTRLPNRRMLLERLHYEMAESRRSGKFGALMFMDLDNFKSLNDTWGHPMGDLLLIEAAQRITGCLREVDTVARFGGDEFVVLLGELDPDRQVSASRAHAVAEKIRSTLALPYQLVMQQEKDDELRVEHHCSSSIGVALFDGRSASHTEVMKLADTAMYAAKHGGRNRIAFSEAGK